MFYETRVVIIFISITHQILSIDGQTLPTKVNDRGSKPNKPTTSYYQPNVFGPNSYAFGFQVNDKATGNRQFRDERRYVNGTTHGSYGYVRPDGSVMVTHFFADSELGYLSESRNFEPGEELVWRANWPTRKPNKSTKNPGDKRTVNLTSILLPVEPINEEHGIDLNPKALEKELINPAVLEVIKGETPLKNDAKKMGFEKVHNFMPAKFPIVPFELPNDDLKVNLNEGLGGKPIPVLNKTNSDTINKLDLKNSSTLPEKSLLPAANTSNTTLPTQIPKKTGLNNNISNKLPEAETNISNKSSDWYDKIINQTRQEYLQIVH